jgi:hypothetical protein
MLKVVPVVATVSLLMAGAAAAADLPRPQPVYQQATVGKMPIGKYPVGKTPIGKTPQPIVTKG